MECPAEKKKKKSGTPMYVSEQVVHSPTITHIVYFEVLRVPTTQVAKMSIDLKLIELTADVLEN